MLTTGRGLVVRIEGFDGNCPQHITPRFTEAEMASAVAPLLARLKAAEAELEHCRASHAAVAHLSTPRPAGQS